MYTYAHIHVYAYTHIHIHRYIYRDTHIRIHICTSIHMCMYIHIYIHELPVCFSRKSCERMLAIKEGQRRFNSMNKTWITTHGSSNSSSSHEGAEKIVFWRTCPYFKLPTKNIFRSRIHRLFSSSISREAPKRFNVIQEGRQAGANLLEPGLSPPCPYNVTI